MSDPNDTEIVDLKTARICKLCKISLPETKEFFHSSKTSKVGLNSRCKSCRNTDSKLRHQQKIKDPLELDKIRQQWRERYYRHREECKKKMKLSARKKREEVLAYYGGKCACCGEEEYEFLAIDHANGGGVKHRKTIGSGICRWIIENNFPEGFRVLCHNCNSSLGHYGYCPHQLEKSSCNP